MTDRPEESTQPEPDDSTESTQPEPDEEPQQDAPEGPDWVRKKRLAAVFGDVLPETTTDEQEPGEGGTSEEWLKGQVPPHHG